MLDMLVVGGGYVGLSAAAPEKVGEVVELGFKALAAAFLTTCLTATIMGVIGA